MLPAAGNYTASWIVEFFNSFPHISFSFTLLPKEEYNFDSDEYLESLAMIALMAVVWLVLTLTVFLIHFCCSKSKGKAESTYNSNGCYCSVCVFVVCVMLTLGCIGVAMYGNMQAKDGITVTTIAVQSGNRTFYALHAQVLDVRNTNDDMRNYVTDLKEFFPKDQSISSVEENLFKIDTLLNVLVSSLSSVEDRLSWSVLVIVTGEEYRNVATYALLGLYCFLCFFGLLGICCRSRWMLIMMIVLGMIGITATCFYLGANLMISVASADFCLDPYFSIYNQTVEKGYLSAQDADYFLKCNQPDRKLYEEEFLEGQDIAENILKFIDWAEENNSSGKEAELLSNFENDVKDFSSSINILQNGLECKTSSGDLEDFISSLCGTTLEGFFTLSVALFAISICMSFVICAAVVTSRRYSKEMYGSDSLEDLDYSDPFLPRTSHYNSAPSRNVTRTNNPIYATSSSNSNYGVTTNTLSFFRPGSDENISLLDHPPPYSPPRNSSRPT